MGGILSSLNTAYTGLKTHQVMVDVTGHNISNANNEHYTRQRVVVSANTPLNTANYSWGQGVEITTIERIHDEFVFARYRKAAQEKEFSSYEEDVLSEVSKYFPEIDGVGIYTDIQNYFDSWKNFANNPGDPAQKLVLGQYTDTLATNIKDTRDRLSNLQDKLHEEIDLTVTEVNRLTKQIANLNQQIKEYESNVKNVKANDLRDQRDEAELALAKLVDITVSKGGLHANSTLETKIADFDDQHIIMVGGFAIVDNTGYHPMVQDNSKSPSGHYSVFFESQDYKRVNMTNNIKGGKLGALYDLALSREQQKGEDCIGYIGKIQQFIDDLDVFAAGLIESTNNIFASSSRHSMTSDHLSLNEGVELTATGYHFNTGSFDYVMYNNQGEELGRRTINITSSTTMKNIVEQMNKNTDDNGDNNGINDIDDEYTVVLGLVNQINSANYNPSKPEQVVFQINPKNPGKSLSISIQDNGTNFAGAIGLNRYFDGHDATDISLAQKYKDDPTLLTSYMEPVEGNFVVANAMQQLQYDGVTFFGKDGTKPMSTIPAFFKMAVTRVAAEAELAVKVNDTKTAVYSSVKNEYSSISQVNIDEELTNLIKYQTGYSANAKAITTIDQMINTLLGIKQ